MTALMGIQIIMIVGTNILLIPRMGITGAAIATFISVAVIRLGSMVLIGMKSNIWPFNLKHFIAIIISVVGTVVVSFIPHISNFYFDSFVRSALLCLIFVPLVLIFNISNELKSLLLIVRMKLLTKKEEHK